MGLSSKQVSIDGFDWSKALLQAQKLELPKLQTSGVKRPPQHQIPAPEQLKCPRCDSTNTKFCYYNNYNKSQPRHFCRTCKRHWTKGGTLRNVPVGGGRKNKRLKKSATPPAAATKPPAAAPPSIADGVLNFGHDQKNFHFQGLVFPPPPQNSKVSGGWPDCENFAMNSGVLNIQAEYSSSTSFEARQSPISTSFPSSNVYDYSDGQDFKPIEIEPTTGGHVSAHPWSCYWSWDEIDTFAATDLNIPWDDHKDLNP